MRSTFLYALTAALASPALIFAGSITASQLVVFGDSLSDNGNAAFELGGTLPGDYAPNAFTDGPNTSPATTGPFGLWIDQFAALAGLPDPQPFLATPGGTNFAIASAQTGTVNPQDIGNQVAAFSAEEGFSAPPGALYVIWGGANDIFNGGSGAAAAANLFGDIETLAAEGAKNFLWLNLPALGDTPLGAGPAASVLNAQSADFNAAWAADIATLDSTGLDVTGVDIGGLFSQIIASPGSFGFTNVTSPAQGTTGNPNNYLFWDTEHPTTAAGAVIAQTAFDDLTGAPEPGSFALLFLGLAGTAIVGRRRSAR